jgi:diaminopimelate decarboxylase
MFGRNQQGVGTLGGAPLDALLDAARCGTPAYLYDLDGMRKAARDLAGGLGEGPVLIAFATKANSAAPVLKALFAEGCGADVVSGTELALAEKAGLPPSKIVFSGVAKQTFEIDRAIGTGPHGIHAIQAESVEEIARIGARAAALGRRARISLRINPGIAIDTHAHVATGHDAAKFGIARGDLEGAFAAIDADPRIALVGVSAHIGSTQTTTEPYIAAARVLFEVARAREAAKGPLEFVDAGGGFGIDYGNGCPAAPADFGRALRALQKEVGASHLQLLVEPGRALVGPYGVLVASVIQPKVSRSSGRRWLMIDAGMNDLIRPALYQARHRIEPLSDDGSPRATFRVVGPICESSDDFGAYELPADKVPSHVVIRDAGAYGFTMSSNYNGRPLPAEVFVSGGRVVEVFGRLDDDAWIGSRFGKRG